MKLALHQGGGLKSKIFKNVNLRSKLSDNKGGLKKKKERENPTKRPKLRKKIEMYAWLLGVVWLVDFEFGCFFSFFFFLLFFCSIHRPLEYRRGWSFLL